MKASIGMRLLFSILLASSLNGLAFGQSAADDLLNLSDEFDNPATLSQWQRVFSTEQWGADQLQVLDINNNRPGRLTMIPFSSTWYNDYRGELFFKTIRGDFVATTDVEVSQRNGTAAPRSPFSLGGIMVRTPRQVTPATWTPGGENYIFLSAGAGNQPGTFQLEVKTTRNSVSTLSVSPGASHVLIQIARIGSYLIALRQTPGGTWVVQQRFYRPDMPETLQVGLTTYTDYPTCATFSPFDHNRTVIRTGNPDLVAAFDYMHFARPQTPSRLVGHDFGNPSDVTDADILGFLGANANTPASPAPTITTINVTNNVRAPAVKHFGINLGWINSYDTGQVTKQLVFRNPGFEGQIYQSVVRCVSGTASACIDENVYSAWPSGFWDGASYEVIWGAARGRAGTIAVSLAPSGGNGLTYQFADSGTPPGAGDYLLLRKRESDHATDGWSPYTSGGAAITTETADLSAEAVGTQAVRLTADGAGQYAVLSSYFDSTVGQTFLQLNGNYHLSFKAKGVGGANTIHPFVRRLAPSNSLLFDRIVTLSNAWNTYDLDFTAAETGSAVGTIQIGFSVSASSAILDEVSLTQSDTDPTNHTAYRDPVVNALKTFRPGILRYLFQQLGDTLDNQIAPPFARLRSGYSVYSTTRDDLEHGLHEFLELCDTLGAEPWYVVPITFSPTEMSNLMEYLGGPANSVYGARRAARGRSTPWTNSFARIHLEFGNEAWNSVYRGASMEVPVAYGNRASEMFGVAKGSPYYNSSQFDLVLGGQAAFVARNRAIENASANHDTFAVAPYFGGNVDDFATNEQLFGPLFAEPEMLSQSGYMRQNLTTLQASARPVPMAVYEVNLHTTNGSISQSALDSFTPSLGAGLAVADHMLMMLRDLGIKDQIMYSLTQYANRRTDGKYVRLWGTVRDMGVTDRKRPQFMAVKLANYAMVGDMMETFISGSNPTWDQPMSNGVQLANAHYIQSYAFSDGVSKSLIIFNLHRTDNLQVNFAGINAPSGAATMIRLSSGAITDNNEDSQTVGITSQFMDSIDPTQPIWLPPYSMSLIQWKTQ